MNSSDDMDLESMINNPFQFVDSEDESSPDSQYSQPEENDSYDVSPASGSAGIQAPATENTSQGVTIDRINKNHPLELRLLNIEKNQLNWDKKVEMLKEIVENQNERIDLLEKELDLYRKQKEEPEITENPE